MYSNYTYNCIHCQEDFTLTDCYKGLKVQCPKCRNIIRAPEHVDALPVVSSSEKHELNIIEDGTVLCRGCATLISSKLEACTNCGENQLPSEYTGGGSLTGSGASTSKIIFTLVTAGTCIGGGLWLTGKSMDGEGTTFFYGLILTGFIILYKGLMGDD